VKDKLLLYEKEGWIKSSKHPSLDLWVWSYTQKTQYDAKWDSLTLICRGLITNKNGEIISRGFNKFFNWEENKLNPTAEELKNVKLTEKVDGSYIGIFWFANQWVINTKGSFITEQGEMAASVFNSFTNVDNFFSKDLTHCFEIIYPQNRIVVNYDGKTELVYLATIDLNGSKSYLKSLPEGMRATKLYDFDFDYGKLKSLNVENEEGFVGTLPNGDMFKIKFENYITLHGIVTHTSSYVIWEYLKTDLSFEFLIENTPDEFYSFVKKVKEDILSHFSKLKEAVSKEYFTFALENIESDKEFAARVFKEAKYPSQMFSLRKNSSIDKWLWEMVKPKFQIPFKDECKN